MGLNETITLLMILVGSAICALGIFVAPIALALGYHDVAMIGVRQFAYGGVAMLAGLEWHIRRDVNG